MKNTRRRTGNRLFYTLIGLVILFLMVTAGIPAPFIIIGIIFIVVQLLISMLVQKRPDDSKRNNIDK
ncbi:MULTISPECIES: hypothetical protein [Paenibacillus]|uniref:Uncharacterized protein n=1 Tax=Paenibacillus urinalis TaxID=521520 RepID=A0AAX3N1N1_9BACL|nr:MULTISPECIES: hypothetical protein [Paenibacillus]WDH83751.1 hypothetical protein PUW23_05855 [Paenibacillus urinalis]